MHRQHCEASSVKALTKTCNIDIQYNHTRPYGYGELSDQFRGHFWEYVSQSKENYFDASNICH